MNTVFRSVFVVILLLVSANGLRAQELPPLLPLFDYPVRDTSVCLGPNGTYYMTGTTGHPGWWSGNDGIRMWRSTDLVTWEAMGLVWSFAANTTWQQPGALWAPSIHYLKGTFWIPYSMNYGGTGILKSTSGNPEGPYMDIRADGPLTGDIDASLFEDDDGKVYFIYQNGGIARMNDDMTGLAEAPRHLAPANAGQVGFEGAFMARMGSKYLLVCAEFNGPDYDCMVASADNIYGPYGDRYLAIRHAGHNDFFKDGNGNWWATFFGNDDAAPCKERPAILRIEMNAEGRIQPLGQPINTTNTVLNPSFESPETEDYTPSFWGWSKLGSGFAATVRNAVYGAAIAGVDGDQFGDIDGNVPGTGIYQDLASQYAPGTAYTLTVDVATRQDNKVQNLSNLRLALLDSANHVAAFTDVLGSQVNSLGAAVATFTVVLPTVSDTDAWANQTIRIRFEDTASGGAGDWVVDNVRLTAVESSLSVTINSPTASQLFSEGIAIPATATVVGGTPPYTVTFHTSDNGEDFSVAGSDAEAPYSVNLAPLTAGTYSIHATVSDSAGGTGTSATNPFTVVPAIPTKLVITDVNGGASPLAGAAYSVTIMAIDPAGNPQNVSAATGVTLSLGSGTAGSLGGVLTGIIPDGSSAVTITGVTNQTAEDFTLQASTNSGPDLTAATRSYTIEPAAAVSLTITGFPNPHPAGVAGSVTVTVMDAYGNTATRYTGTVALSSSDPLATFSQSPYTFASADGGIKTLDVTLNTVGTHSITASDGTLTDTQSGIVVTTMPTRFTFTTPGTTLWTCPAGVTAVQLLVAGGGGGGGTGGAAGGGGAGGLIYYGPEAGAIAPDYPVIPGNTYTITVGTGGAAHANGQNSVFNDVTALGGGYGGQRWNEPGGSGGSGGGASVQGWGSIASGAVGTPGQGHAGGGSSVTNGQNKAVGGGGGGAGGVGGNGQDIENFGYAGNGGDGLTYSISGSAVTYAGGGGGSMIEQGADGLGGAGYLNPGGGGMASGANNFAGRNGIVIVSFTTDPPASPFSNWIDGFDVLPSNETGFASDPNKDGVANGLAWILLGGTPMGDSRSSLPVATGSEGKVILEFTCLKPAGLGTASLEVQFNHDLGTTGPWHSAAVPGGNATVNSVVFTVTGHDATHNRVIAEIPRSAASDGTLFGRLRASGN